METYREPMQWGFAPFRLDAANECLWQVGQRIALRPKTYAVLVELVTQAGQLVTKEALLEAVWPDTAVGDDVLKASIRELRQVLGETARAPRFIATEYRRGYRFIAPVTITPVTAEPLPFPSPLLAEEPPELSSIGIRSTLCVAREAELAQLHACYAAALQGERQFVVVTGEAGIGKTTLIDTFANQIASGVWRGQGQCIEQYGAGEAYLPILEALGQLSRTPQGAQWIDLLRQQAPSWLLHMPALIPAEDYDTLQRRHGRVVRERMLRELAEAVEVIAAERLLVLVFEDLHWSDSATLDCLAYMARRRTPAQLLILGTYRPVDAQVHTHPIHRLTQELALHGHCVELRLSYLSEVGIGAYLTHRFGTTLESLAPVLHRRTSGNPLFLVAIVDAIIGQGVLQERQQGWVITDSDDEIAIETPESLRRLIEQHFEQLNAPDQSLLEAASTVGREFAAASVGAGRDMPLEEVERRCVALARHGQFITACGTEEWPDGTVTARYRFIHDLYREVVYARLPVSQQIRLHRHIGLHLEVSYGPQARMIAVELARHFVCSRDTRRAVQYLWYAGEQAVQRSAYQEAITHLSSAIAMLRTLPVTLESLQQEIAMQLTLAVPLIATKGYGTAEVVQIYSQAQVLCQEVGESPHLFTVLRGLWNCFLEQGNFQGTLGVQEFAEQLEQGNFEATLGLRELAEQLLQLAQERGDVGQRIEAHRALGTTLFFMGEQVPAQQHFQQGIALYQGHPQRFTTFLHGADPGVLCQLYASWSLWFLGYPDQALQQMDKALTLAQELEHLFSLAFALPFSARLRLWRGEAVLAQSYAESAIALATEQEFPQWLALGTMMYGEALAAQGKVPEGLQQMQQGLHQWQTIVGELSQPWLLSAVAEGYGKLGQSDKGLQVVREGLALVHKNGERICEAELYRRQGELYLQRSALNRPQAESCFQQALTIARQQHAKAWELRAAMSLSRLWHQQAQHQQALHVLEEVYRWFTEGFETQDIQTARTLLQECQRS